MLQRIRDNLFVRYIAIIFTGLVILLAPGLSYAQNALELSAPGSMLFPTWRFEPAQLIGLRLDVKNPFRFYFIVNKGDRPLPSQDKKKDYSELIGYFLAALTIPNDDMWVNLSPVEPDRVIPDNFARTGMGSELLEEDFVLKKLTASLLSPQSATGKDLWDKIYSQLRTLYGSSNVPVNLADRVWISAGTADIYQKGDSAFLVKKHLKVSLENDHFGKNSDNQNNVDSISSEAMRKVVLPVIEQEVNHGASFAQLRRIYDAMILATWFKRKLKENILNQVYSDKNKTLGVGTKDQKAKERIYQEYLEAYRKGAFNYIQREFNPVTNKISRRKYIAGGTVPVQDVNIIADPAVGEGFLSEYTSAGKTDIVDTDLIDAGDNVWRQLRSEAAAIATKQPLLKRHLQEIILDSPTLEAALAKLLGSELASGGVSARDLEEFILRIFESSADIRFAIREDLSAVLRSDPAAGKFTTPFLYFKGFHALEASRVANWLWQKTKLHEGESNDLSLWLQSRISKVYAVDVHPAADIAHGVVFDHGTGIVVGETARIGPGAYILHEVTLGSNGKDTGDRHPKIGPGVKIGAGAKILGDLDVGSNAKIGAGAIVAGADVPAGATYIGQKAQQLVRNGKPAVVPVPVVTQVERGATLEERRDDVDRATIRSVERAVARLETRWLNGSGPGDYEGVSVASGVAGGHIALRYALTRAQAPQKPEIILLRPAYGGTEGNVKLYQSYGYPVKVVSDLAKLDEALDENVAAVIFESPANPSLPVVDIEKTVKGVRAKSKNAVIIFDGAFATSLGQQPLKYGVDIVVQVVTKGLSGDGVVFGTVNVAHRQIADELRKLRTEPISVADALRLRRGLANFELRFARQQANALRYLAYLKFRPEVKFVRYPGDEEHPNYAVVQKQMENPGHMLYFDLGSADKAKAFMALLRYFRTIEHAVSLGDVRNLMQMPGYGALSNLSDDELAQGGVTRGGIRWSVGIEDPADVERELNAIFTILQLYDGNFDEIPYDQLDKIFMQPTTDALGKVLYKLRKFPIVVPDGDKFTVEPQIADQVIQLKTKRAQQAAQVIDTGTRIDLYNPQTLLIHHTGIWGLFSGDHSSLVATDHALSSAYRASDPDDLRGKFGYAGEAGKLSVPPTGAYSGYGRFGSPSSETVQILTALAEAGAKDAFSFKHQGVSTPTFDSALELLLNYWTIDQVSVRQKSGNKAPLRVAVVTRNASHLADFAGKYRKENARRFSLSGGNGVELDIVSPSDNGTFSGSLSEADFVLADEGVWNVRDIPVVKASAPKAQLAWVNTRGIRNGLQPIKNGADITLLDIQDEGKSAAGVLVIPQKDAEGLLTRRNYNSIATRSGSDILVHQFPYLLLAGGQAAKSTSVVKRLNLKSVPKNKGGGGIDLDEKELQVNIKGVLNDFPVLQNNKWALIDVKGFVPVIRSIVPAGYL